MISNHIKLPKQRLSLDEKLADNKQWAKDVIDHMCLHTNKDTDDYNNMLSNYKLYNNVLDQEDFERECNPMGIEVGQFKDFIMPYNKTYNKIQVLLGEELKRKMDFRAIIENSDGIKSKENKKSELLREYLEEHINTEVDRLKQKEMQKNPPPQQQGEQPGEQPGGQPGAPQGGQQDPKQQQQQQQIMDEYQKDIMNKVNKVMNPEEIEKYMSTEYQEAREIMVQKLINYLNRSMHIKELSNDSFKHGLIAGGEFTYVDILHKEPIIKVLNPLGVFYHKSPDVKYIQDGDYAGYAVRMSSADLLSRFEGSLSEEQKERLDGDLGGIHGIHKDIIGKEMKYHNKDIEFEYAKGNVAGTDGPYGSSDGDDWEVIHVEWITQTKVGFITYQDEDGEEVTDMVSEYFNVPEDSEKVTSKDLNDNTVIKYIFPEGEELEWKWIPEIWEGTRIGSDIYIDIRKKKLQYRRVDNPFKVSLGYHGLIYNNMNAPSQSVMDRMKPYQFLHFVVYHKLKKLIARDRGQVFSMDLSLVDEKIGLEKSLYYLEEMDLDLFNSLQNAHQPGASQRGKVSNSISRSNMQHISGYLQLLSQLDMEIGDAAGVTKQREGQVGAYESVTNAQSAITQSSTITEIFFNLHNLHWQRVMNSLVQATQLAWQGRNVIKQFVLDDLSRHVLDLSGDDLYNADFGIYVSNAIQDAELVNTLKQMALPILQNEGKITDIIKIFKSLSSSQLEQEFESQEREREARQQRAQESQQQQQQQQIEAQNQAQERQFTHEKELKQMEIEADLAKAEIDVFKFQKDLDMNNNGVPDPLEIEKLKTQKDMKDKELSFKEKELKAKMKMEKIKANAKPNPSK